MVLAQGLTRDCRKAIDADCGLWRLTGAGGFTFRLPPVAVVGRFWPCGPSPRTAQDTASPRVRFARERIPKRGAEVSSVTVSEVASLVFPLYSIH